MASLPVYGLQLNMHHLYMLPYLAINNHSLNVIFKNNKKLCASCPHKCGVVVKHLEEQIRGLGSESQMG